MKKILIVVLTLLALAMSAAAQLRVVESEMRMWIGNGKLRLTVPVENLPPNATAATLSITTLERWYQSPLPQPVKFRAAPGTKTIEVEIPNDNNDVEVLIWRRIKYVLSAGGEQVSGIVSYSRILDGLFKIESLAISKVYPGMTLPVRLRVTGALDKTPIADVAVKADIYVSDDSPDNPEAEYRAYRVSASTRTGADGFAEVVFKLPDNLPADTRTLQLRVRGEKDGLKSSATNSLELPVPLLSTFYMLDKPLYQPGQKVQFRVLLMNSTPKDTGFVVAPETSAKFRIKDEQGLTLFRSETKTSRFGIASGEWTLPPDAKLGTYKIELENDDYYRPQATTFKVSRYDLPNFVVNLKSDQTFYLFTEKEAEIRVTAKYLFGKPVVGGKVRLLAESNRYWDWYQQGWTGNTSLLAEGDCDAAGECVFKVPMEKLSASQTRRRTDKFSDITLLAEFTDPTSNRSEEGRFDLRLSVEPIHIYVAPFKNINPQIPFETYVSTQNADGSPCRCEFEIRGRLRGTPIDTDKVLARGRTDSNGNAAVVIRTPESIIDGTEDLELSVVATNGDKRGTVTSFARLVRNAKDILIRTDKALYKPGEPLRVSIDATHGESVIFAEVRSNGSTVARRRVALRNGHADVYFPYSPLFTGELTIAAIAGVDGDDSLQQRTERRVVYPATSDRLTVTAKTENAVYRPGEDATMKFAVSGDRRNPSESALGVAVIDRAVEERDAADNRGKNSRPILGDFARFTASSWIDFDQSKLTPELQLTAMSDLRYGSRERPRNFGSDRGRELRSVFDSYFNVQFTDLAVTLKSYFERTLQYPRDAVSLARTLAIDKKFDFEKMRDPWGKAYRVRVRAERETEILELVSDGADKRADAPDQALKDDFVAFSTSFEWFRARGTQLNLAVNEYFKQTGKFVIDDATFREALAVRNIDSATLIDPWGTPLRFLYRIWGQSIRVEVLSAGPDRVFDETSLLNSYQYYYNRSDVWVWAAGVDYFKTTRQKIGKALQEHLGRTKLFPQTVEEFKEILLKNDLDFAALRDPFGQPLAVEFSTYDLYADRVSVETKPASEGSKSRYEIKITPVTRKLGNFVVKNVPTEKNQPLYNYYNEVSRFTGIISEQSRTDVKPRTVDPYAVLTNGNGAVFAIVSDTLGTPINGARLIARNVRTGVETYQYSESSGIVIIPNLEPGTYKLQFEYRNNQYLIGGEVVIAPNDVALIKVSEAFDENSGVVGVIGETSVVVETMADSKVNAQQVTSLPVNGRNFTSLLSMSPSVTKERSVSGARSESAEIVLDGADTSAIADRDREPNSTPRVREYFPESLLWIPEIVTDKNGKAEVKFRTGDNITTWNVYAVASDEKGRVGLARSAFKTFQPFFVDLDSPKFLTVGDEIYLPTQVRNYTPAPVKVDLSMEKSDWFDLLGPERQNIDVKASATANGIFGFRATRAIDGGRQRVTALAEKNNDAVEKPVTVRPDGEEIIKTESLLVSGKSTTRIEFPANTLPDTSKVVLRLYPNMLGHVVEAVDGLLKRPYGCAEQTISSTYPNLMLLRIASKSDGVASVSKEMQTEARINLKRGYERLLGYQNSNGAFGYWGGNDRVDIALTAYAVRFLMDAGAEIEVDKAVIERAANFLITTQQADGSYVTKYNWEKDADPRRTVMTTSYVARLLGRVKAAKSSSSQIDAALEKSLSFLKLRTGVIYEPYTLALYGLTALDAGLTDEAAAAAKMLRENAIRESDRVYWKLETNTPFYGWGTAGRVETTALVMQFLQKFDDEKDKPLIGGALMFLLVNKDRFGVWHSTQTTINVLEAFLGAVGKTGVRQVKIRYDGRELPVVEIAAGRIEPVRIELPANANGAALEIDTTDLESQIMAQVVKSHYISWNDSVSTNRNENQSRAVEMDYKCDKLSPKIMETVTCAVTAERIGFKGYGMLLAEIGIPPGAEVSRELLDKAIASNWAVSRYEILPDRIVVYMWAQPGGTKFNFSFKPRYAVNAQTPASFVYDYYNEEAKATVAPMRFKVLSE